MKFGIIGLGRMGSAIAQRVIEAGYEVVGFDPLEQTSLEAHELGVETVDSPADVARVADVVWIIVPAGKPVDDVLGDITSDLKAGAIVIDGGNSKFTDSIRRATELGKLGVQFLDCGTSGGLQGRELGFSLMVGGERDAYNKVLPVLESIAYSSRGVGYVGPSGAGHYVKMVHNGIEYALLQAYAEGYQLLKEGSFKQEDLDLAEITRIWDNGSIIRSWIVELSHEIFTQDQQFKSVSGEIQESGTGQWTVEDADKNHVPVKLIEEALEIRRRSRETGGNYATKVVALLRHAFGGHPYKKIESA